MKNTIILYVLFAFIITCIALTPVVSAETVEDNYKLYCTQCHGLNGNGMGINKVDMPTTPRDHTNTEEMAKLSDKNIYQAIRDGGAAVSKSSLMPPWKGVMTDPEINDMVKYLRKLCNCKER